MKLGSGDWAFDKTQLGLYYPNNQLPTSGILYWTTHVWASNGMMNSGANNMITWLLPLGQIRVHSGSSWEISVTPQTALTFGPLGNYTFTPDAWHTVTIGMDIPNNKWAGMWIDGVHPFSSLNGAQGHNYDPTGSLGYLLLTIFIVPGSDYQSIHALGQTNGWYMYVDDVSFTTTNVQPSLTPVTSTTSVQTSSVAVNSTSTTTKPVDEFTFPVTIIAVLFLLLVPLIARRRTLRTG
jgi:hypothetical protein